MLRLVAAACCLFLTPLVQSAPAPSSHQHLAARRLLGSSFAVAGNNSFDYIVVGGGTAGLVVATRLAEDPSKQVAVIEAGSFYEIGNGNLSQIPAFGAAFGGKSPTAISPLVDWGFITTPQEGLLNQRCFYARGKCLGGSSARNYLTYQRGPKGAYKMWADAVDDPSYKWDNFLPFFEKSLHFTPPDPTKRPANATPQFDASSLGNGQGPLSVTFANYAQPFSSWVQRALKRIGINPINGLTSGNILGSSYQLLTIDATNMTRDSSETSFLQKNGLPRFNLVVYQSTLAKKILFKGTTATGVEIDFGGISFVLSARKEVIVSAGAFQSPQLLMVSGVGPAATLQQHGIPVVADRSGVGQNMWDHVLGGPSYRVSVRTTSALGNPAFAAAATQEFLESATGILTDSGADLLAWEKLPASSLPNTTLSPLRSQFPSDWPDVEYFSTSAFYGLQENYLLDAPRDPFNYASIAIALNAPLSRGSVSISSASMSDPPIINPNWLTHPVDQAVAVAGYKRVRQIFASSALKPILVGDEFFPGKNVSTDEEILELIRKSFATVFHASCTCKMGVKEDEMAVVDSKARVFGVEGLRVVDASAFAVLPPGHPVATVYALAEKIADDILKGY